MEVLDLQAEDLLLPAPGAETSRPGRAGTAPTWWIVEFGGKRSVLMTAVPGDTAAYVARRAGERRRLLYE